MIMLLTSGPIKRLTLGVPVVVKLQIFQFPKETYIYNLEHTCSHDQRQAM